MEIEVEYDEKEVEKETVEFVSSVSFNGCTRKDLEELGRFFLHAAKSLPTPRINDREIQVSHTSLYAFSSHFSDHETSIFVSLDINEV